MFRPDIHYCVDIDNVIAQTDVVMRQIITGLTAGKVNLLYEDVVAFNYHECKDSAGCSITKDEWHAVHDRFSEEKNILAIEPMPGAVKALAQLAKYGTVHLVTSRQHKARKPTIDWLVKHGFPESCDLHFLKHREKHNFIKHFTAAVEDDYDQAVGYASVGQAPCYLIEHPWNRGRAEHGGIEWVKGWDELGKKLLNGVA